MIVGHNNLQINILQSQYSKAFLFDQNVLI